MRMKKIFTFMLVAFAALAARATDYNEPIIISINGVSVEQAGVISVVQNGDNYDLTMKNFVLNSEDGPMGVGNVVLTGIAPVKVGNGTLLKTKQDIMITEGDDPNIPFWVGPGLGEIPVDLQGVLEDGKIRCVIHIDMSATLEQIIEVNVGTACKTGYHFQNDSFEEWHTSSGNYVEPNGWHSFESGTGLLISSAGHHIEKSADAHSGEASARVFSTEVNMVFWKVVANGTMTTGRMNAASATASNKDNNAYLDMSKTDVDGNGDPFYTPLFSRPDSIVVWVKFKQGTTNASHPYATVSAVITDGTYYQDPEDKEYSNVVAKAKNNTIAVTNGEWVRVSAPFEYTESAVDPQAILVTISTNADAGQGSKDDEVLVDDIALIYNSKLTSLKVFGQEVEGFDPAKKEYEVNIQDQTFSIDDVEAEAEGRATMIVKKVEETETGYKATVKVLPGDMANITEYVLNIKSTVTAIQQLQQNEVKSNAIYNLQGQQVKKAVKGLYIMKGKKVVLK